MASRQRESRTTDKQVDGRVSRQIESRTTTNKKTEGQPERNKTEQQTNR